MRTNNHAKVNPTSVLRKKGNSHVTVEEIVDLTTKDVDFQKQIQNLQVEHNMKHLPLFEFAKHIVNLQIWYEL